MPLNCYGNIRKEADTETETEKKSFRWFGDSSKDFNIKYICYLEPTQ